MSEDSGTACIGKSAIRISSTAMTGNGAAIQTVSVVPGKRYVFSAWAKASVTEMKDNASVFLQIQDKDKQILVNSALTRPDTGGWKRLQVAFTAPADTSGSTTVRLVPRMRYIKGSVWFDGFQLEEGDVAGRLNLIANNGFTYSLYGYTKTGSAGCFLSSTFP